MRVRIARLVGADMSTVSKHLSAMKRAGLVDDRTQGLRVHYRLRVPCMFSIKARAAAPRPAWP